MTISGISKGDSIYQTYISEFLYLWPEVRSILRPPHYKSMGEIPTSSECHPMPSICSGSLYYRSLSVIQPKQITCDLRKVLPRSSEVTIGFSAITFDWKQIEPPDNVHRVCLVKTRRMMYNMTYLGQVMTWPEVKVMTCWPFEVNLYIVRRVLTS